MKDPARAVRQQVEDSLNAACAALGLQPDDERLRQYRVFLQVDEMDRAWGEVVVLAHEADAGPQVWSALQAAQRHMFPEEFLPRPITRLAEYKGESEVVVEATQLPLSYSRSEARRVVDEWVEFFASGPSSIQRLRFVSRTPKRLFNALRGQTQLEALVVKWGDYADLTPLAGMTHLRKLHLGGASSVEALEPLSQLTRVEDLLIEDLRRARDLSPVGAMSGVTALELGGDWMSSRVAHVKSFAFLRDMPQLRHLLLHTIAADDLDYTPLLALPNLKSVRVMAVAGMQPGVEVLKASVPWSE